MTQTILEPVVITGASGQVGRALISELQRHGVKPQALVRQPAGLNHCQEYCDWMSSPEAEHVLASAGTVIHLAGNLKPANGDYNSANVKTTERVAKSISAACCRRLVFLSFHGATTKSKNPYLTSKAQAENILLSTHENPDCDGLGSEIAVYYYAKNLNKNCRIINFSQMSNTTYYYIYNRKRYES